MNLTMKLLEVFPTQVGVILGQRLMTVGSCGVPHTGGGDPKVAEYASWDEECSPHRWG